MQITARDRLGVVGAGVGRRTRAFDVVALLETVEIVPREPTQHAIVDITIIIISISILYVLPVRRSRPPPANVCYETLVVHLGPFFMARAVKSPVGPG